MDDEVWRPIAGFEGLYEVSDHGRVRVLNRVVVNRHGVRKHYAGKVLAPLRKGEMGYHGVQLHRDDRCVRQAYVHHLVLETFVGPRPSSKAVTRHLNGDHLNNRLENLAWGTQSENMFDRVKHARARSTAGSRTA